MKWDIWWDFRDEWIVLQTDHPSYKHVDVICMVTTKDADEFEQFEEWFDVTRKDVMSGRVSIHTWMKKLGHKKR